MLKEELKFDFHELANFYPMQDTARFQELVEGMRQSGYRDEFPIVLYEGKILDGRNRYRAAIEAGIDPFIVQFSGDDPMEFVIQANSNRRDLEPGQRAAIAKKIRDYWREKGRANMSEGGKNKGLSNWTNLVDSRAQAAKSAGVGSGTIARVDVIEKLAPDLFEKVASGEISTNKAYTEAKRRENKRVLESIEVQEVKALEGVYDVIVIDPPWQMEKIEREVAPEQAGFDYPTMSLDEIGKLEIPAAQDCHVWLWTTHKYLPDAFNLFRLWAVKYVCTFVWHKPGGFQVYGLPQYNCEFALYGRIGSPMFIDTKAFNACFDAPRGGHSEKPGEFYDTLRRVTAGRRLDMFNRRKIEGFDGWGKESA